METTYRMIVLSALGRFFVASTFPGLFVLDEGPSARYRLLITDDSVGLHATGCQPGRIWHWGPSGGHPIPPIANRPASPQKIRELSRRIVEMMGKYDVTVRGQRPGEGTLAVALDVMKS